MNPEMFREKVTELSENCTKDFLEKHILQENLYANEDDLLQRRSRKKVLNSLCIAAAESPNNSMFSLARQLNKAWKEYYTETLQSKINIELIHNRTTKNMLCSPLMMIGKLKEHIKKMFNVNNINYIKLFSRDRPGFDPIITYLDNDNYNLYKYGFTDDSKTNTINIKLEATEEAPSPAPISELIMEQEPEPAPEPTPESNVIHAELVNSSRNDEINILKTKVSELEARLKKLENISRALRHEGAAAAADAAAERERQKADCRRG
tara:strand:+ start:60 stop:854 length:795 start_codon:yes stop_codon:yes gene_type:complete